MLGELYIPSGLALETARAVLELDDVYACNVALGCSNGCEYCYGPLACKKSKEEWLKMRLPQEKPVDLVRKQFVKATLKKQPLASGASKGFFASFFTDPFHPLNTANTNSLVTFLVNQYPSRIATLSKLGIPNNDARSVRPGISIVSLDEGFREVWEQHTASYSFRLHLLEMLEGTGQMGWASMEPYPPSAIHKQPIQPLLERLKEVGCRLIVFGKWNYDKRASTEEARQEYADNVAVLTDFCKSNSIRLHVKSETLDFIQKSAHNLSF